jgi:DNA-binding CsgD family transcriptional regulator
MFGNVARMGRNTSSGGKAYRFTKRQAQVLNRLLVAESEKQIAAGLKISIHTVHKYVRQIYLITDVSCRSELLVKMLGPSQTDQDLKQVERMWAERLGMIPIIPEPLD